jgi:ribonuclease T1
MTASPGRRRYRLFLLLVAAAALVVWFLTPVDQDDPPASSGDTTTSSDSRSGSPSGSPSSSPTHELTQTNTPSTEPTTSPSTPPAGEGTDPASGLPVVRLADLPPEAARTVRLIDAGGPFPEPEHDGGTFGNREELLPDEPYGYYREYTVPTPGLATRGARRIVAGRAGELYWTADHYSSFSRIRR